MKNTAKSIVAGLFLLIISLQVKSQIRDNYLQKTWSMTEIGSAIGSTNFFCEDFNGNGKNEILFTGNNGYDENYFSLYSYANGNYYSSWSSKLYSDNYISNLQVANLNGDEYYEIYVFLSDGTIEVYDGATMEITNTYSTISTIATQSAVADVDGDGEMEIVVTSSIWYSNYLHIYDASTFNLEYENDTLGAHDVEVGDVDGDGENEIILTGFYILDGATREVEWHHTDEWDRRIELCDVNSDGVVDIISNNNSSNIKAFDGELHTTLWEFSTGNSIDALTVTDVEGDGIYEILVGFDDYNEAIAGYNANTQQKLWQNTDVNAGVTKIGVGDSDNDGIKEFFWGSGISSTASDHLHIAGFDYYQTEWKSEVNYGYFSVDIFDLDADDTLEIIGVSRQGDNEIYGGSVMTYNGIDHLLMNSFQTGYYESNHCMATGNINQTEQGEIVVAVDDRIIVYDGVSYGILWESEDIYEIYDIELADIDNDNVIEIIVGDENGQITVFNGESFEQEWKSIITGNGIGGIEVENCDDDEALEIIFFNMGGIIQIYDGSTHLLQWQSTNIDNVSAIDVKDYDQNGIMDIIVGDYGGEITFINCTDFTITESFTAFEVGVYGLEVGNLDSTSQMEIVASVNSLKVFNIPNFELLYEIENVGNLIGKHDNIKISDTDANQHKEILFTSDWGIFQFEVASRYPDTVAPEISWVSPPAGMQMLGTNLQIEVRFSESIDEITLNDQNIFLLAEDNSQIPKAINYNSENNTVTLIPDENLPAENEITVLIKGTVTDTANNGLDGNYNGYSEGSPIDDYSWSFITGHGPDIVGPEFSELNSDSYLKIVGLPININGYLTDSSDYASSPLRNAECFIDNIGTNGEGLKMTPLDGAYDEFVEEVELKIETLGWETGEHILYFHGLDLAGNWGEFSELSFTFYSEFPGNWTMFGSNPQHTAYNSYDSINIPLKLSWSKEMANMYVNQVCIVNDQVVATTNSSAAVEGVYALNTETGETNWEQHLTASAYINPPAYAYGHIYVQQELLNDSYLLAYDLITGNLKWQSPYDSQIDEHFAPTVADGQVFINGGTFGGVYAFDAISGEENWFYDLPQYDKWTPAYLNDTIYSFTADNSNDNGYLAALNAQSGMLLWDKSDISFNWSGYSMNTCPVIDTVSRIIFVTSEDFLYAIDLNTHQTLWSKQGIFITPAVHNGILYCINYGHLKGYDVYTGQKLWEIYGSPNISYSPVISNNYVFISSETDVYAIGIDNHEEQWHYGVGGFLTIGHNQLFVASNDGNLYAFNETSVGINENEISNEDMPILNQNYPNPVINNTTISYSLSEESFVELVVIDINGIEKIRKNKRNIISGVHSFNLDTKHLSPGIYFYQLIVNGKTAGIKKLVVIE